ncbi:hypothetical protein PV326_002300, partial [Microctonus aethiopoides]
MTDRSNTFGQPSAGVNNNQINEIPLTYTFEDVAELLRLQNQEMRSLQEETLFLQEILDEKLIKDFERMKDRQKTINKLFERLEAQRTVSGVLHNNIPTQNNSCQQVPVPAPRTSAPFSWMPVPAPRMLMPIPQTQTTVYETYRSQLVGNCHIPLSLNLNDYTKNVKNDTNKNYARLHTQMPSLVESGLRENLNVNLDLLAATNNKKISNATTDKNNLSKIVQ